jgi:hypothetical protein
MFATKTHKNALCSTLADAVSQVNRFRKEKINGIKDLAAI